MQKKNNNNNNNDSYNTSIAREYETFNNKLSSMVVWISSSSNKGLHT